MEKKNSNIFGEQVLNFVNRIEALRLSLPFNAIVIEAGIETVKNDFLQYLKKHSLIKKESKKELTLKIPSEQFTNFFRYQQQIDRLTMSYNIIPCSFIVTLVSQYDVLISQLIRMMYNTHPEKLKKTDKSLDYKTLISFNSIEEATNSLIEKEVESVIRDDHLSQISYFEKNLKITLQSDQEILDKFVEITERRNLFVHCDGIVNEHYLTSCSVPEDEKPKVVGDKLKVTPQYFQHAVDTILEIGIKLTHIVWNKLLPSETDSVQKSINHVSYELIYTEKYQLAIKLLDFALSIFNNKLLNPNRLYYIVNKAQAYKWLGEKGKMEKTISDTDWTTLSPLFQISYFVLTDNYKKAADIMYVIKESKDLTKTDYQIWPLFQKFRESDHFKKAYKELFGEESSSFKKVNPKPLSKIVSIKKIQKK